MGKIYSWERIENSSIPQSGDFLRAKNGLFENLEAEIRIAEESGEMGFFTKEQ
jgi:hypothetical protein